MTTHYQIGSFFCLVSRLSQGPYVTWTRRSWEYARRLKLDDKDAGDGHNKNDVLWSSLPLQTMGPMMHLIPDENVTRPADSDMRPDVNFRRPADNVTRPDVNIRRPADNVTRPADNVRIPDENVTRPADSDTRPDVNFRRPADNVTRPAYNVTRPAYNVTRMASCNARGEIH
ncbi:hypothetical protein Btru_049244 [Bulinus truncatus]|nr:hypothetical protein Btru_049244 [Bulinus truncatus]